MMRTSDAISIAEGNVRHRRFQPTTHAFSYPVSYVVIDTSYIDNAQKAAEQPFAINRWGLVSINRADLITPIDCSIYEAVRLRLEQQQITMQQDWRIDLLTLPRFMGYTFNPVSFYTVYNSEQHIIAILSDITNTPWGERHTYLHIAQQIKALGETGHTYQFKLAKNFHVSPFMPMNMTYDWRFNFSHNKQIIHMRLLENTTSNLIAHSHNTDATPFITPDPLKQQLIFDATFSFSKKPFRRFSAWYLTLRYPLLPFRVVWQIHWHALRLWLKGVPFHRHPKKTTVLPKPPV